MKDQIRVLRAEAAALSATSGNEILTANPTPESMIVRLVIVAIASAKVDAANALEAEVAALKPPLDDGDQSFTFNPKGKTTK